MGKGGKIETTETDEGERRREEMNESMAIEMSSSIILLDPKPIL